ncbi:HNH endonuclease [Nocardioides rubriscoriae]|uniref:HNH endonuclease n=1 Tax=Nocardioides rubriscoriae TaxID=642762 RepID=UPI0011DF2E3A|nr:HNH endonuclease signature motif containing protein [Nocardioides rubriscoriae]
MSALLDQVRGLRAALVEGAVDPAGHDTAADAERVALLAALEQLKSAACAAQGDLAVGLDASVREQDAAVGVPSQRRGRGVAAQVALARQESPHRGQVLLGLAKDLATDLPATRRALREGRLNEHRAQVVARETGGLGRSDRAVVDEGVCGDARLLDGLGTRALAAEVAKRAYALDPASVVRRHARAVGDRNVTVRPAPEGMAYLTGLVPMVQGVACWANLKESAEALRAQGDPRSRGQIMADLLVERLTGQSEAAGVPVTVDLVMSDATLVGAGHEPATVPGWGPVPAQVAREVVARASEAVQAWVRRLYADPTGRLVAMSTRQRLATDGLSEFLTLRDQGICRTPWCDAPIRDADHVVAWADGGATDADQLQGLCEACDHTKQAPGWRQRVVDDDDGRHAVETVTPTGHRHRSRAPSPPSPARPSPVPQSARVDYVSAPERGFASVIQHYRAA